MPLFLPRVYINVCFSSVHYTKTANFLFLNLHYVHPSILAQLDVGTMRAIESQSAVVFRSHVDVHRLPVCGERVLTMFLQALVLLNQARMLLGSGRRVCVESVQCSDRREMANGFF